MRPLRTGSPEKSEKFCSTRNYVVCDKGKLVRPSRSPNPCLNYENTTYCLPNLTRVCTKFTRAISRATTNISARSSAGCKPGSARGCEPRRSSSCESGSSSSGEPRRTGTAAGAKRASWGTRRARRDDHRHIKPCASHRWKSRAGCRTETQRRPGRH